MAKHLLAPFLLAGASLSALAVPPASGTLPNAGAAPGLLPTSTAIASPPGGESTHGPPKLDVLADMLEALNVLQKDYFAPWVGTWPTSIDWTGAVMGTHVSGALRTFSEAITLLNSSVVADWKLQENLIDGYFNHIVAYYFGENAFAIRNEAYDDILWVVLGWIEGIRFINRHTELHYSVQTQQAGSSGVPGWDAIESILANQTWHGNDWSPAFAHRARVFWDLASKGWDTILCGGGMTWNPQLLPYKNAITNELWIAGSISMYLYFPGDDNPSPFDGAGEGSPNSVPEVQAVARDPKFLQAAIDGYEWLANSNMTNDQGLYADGFHISGLTDPDNNNTKCDERSETVFTYNQGVLLTGLRGLWQATGATPYLADGHQLIRNVINATGYDLIADEPVDDLPEFNLDELPPYRGLGRAGVLEDPCDASGTCSQNGQTFKGIFFHHLTAFCEPLGAPIRDPGSDVEGTTPEALAWLQSWHDETCARYSKWIRHNVAAARGTLTGDGKYGQWWTAGLLANYTGAWPTMDTDGIDHDDDYRNYGVPQDTTWRRPGDPWLRPLPTVLPYSYQAQLGRRHAAEDGNGGEPTTMTNGDPNQRGRGRTVETQGGGLALMRAYWSIAQTPRAA